MYRLVTRSDFDGLVCAMLLEQLELIEQISFAHPRDVQDGSFPISGRDITTNLPYRSEAHLVFDHHASEVVRTGGRNRDNHVIDETAPSAARVVYEFFGGAAVLPAISAELLRAVDRADSATYSVEEILHPTGWVLLGFIMDPRTGLGRFHQFRLSNYELMMRLVEHCRELPIDEVLALPDVAERVALYEAQAGTFREQLERCTTERGEVAVVDLRGEETVHAGNRFMVYALFPTCRASVHVMWGRERKNTVLAVGKSIFDRTLPADIGTLMLARGGGGHRNAGTCQVPHGDAERVLAEVVDALNGSDEGGARPGPGVEAPG